MMRINLLRNVSSGKGGPGESSNATRTSVDFKSFGSNLDVLYKLIVAGLPILGIWFTEQSNISEKQDQLSDLTQKLTTVSAEVDNLKPQVEAVQKFKEEQQKLETRIDTIRVLSKARLLNVRALEAIQSSVPQRAWVTKLSLVESKVEVSGEAIDDTDVSSFMQALEDSVYFANVLLLNTTQQKNDEGVIRSFKIQANLER